MHPHNPYRFEITDARPVMPGRVKIALCLVMFALAGLAKLAGGW